ncbi:ATP-binding protein [Pseudokineococcus marinus]|uniref:ATP-binding protein n=1 Tax=Pseudokineococcus marinus TaxID=351215 RepID=A0A849BLH7_9ACTN|nr:ATP-binding protein [Pseudokineococcus marinus]NNH22185.1 ATP-binding protein [Pseudokineococcus marinus]
MPVLDLGDDPSQVPRARHWVLEHCARSGMGEDGRFAVELVTSELVGNAYQHGRPPVRVEVQEAEDATDVAPDDLQGGAHGGRATFVLRVTDHGTGAPAVRDADDDALGGRGLALVEMLAAAWGVEHPASGPGTTVWCRLAG